MVMVWVLIFLVGLTVGSFLNVVVYRVLHGDSPFKGRSKCPYCKKKISWYDNIPLVSFVVLKGRCRHCHKKISWRYPVLELLTGVLFVWWFGVGQLFFRLTQQPYRVLQPVFWLTVGVGLTSLAVADGFYGVLPDVFTVSLAAVTFAYRLGLSMAGIMQWRDLGLFVASGVGAAGFLGFLVWVTKGKGMGWGDVKLAFLMGVLLGVQKTILAVWLAFLTGAVVGIILIIAGRKKLKQTIPFGPFLILGTAVALVWGEKLASGYLRMMGL